jgi:virulence factor Mce-like protein
VSRRLANQLIAASMFLGILIVGYFAFHPSLPFTHGYRVKAITHSANQLRHGSPVRISGIDVGKVVAIDRGPGNTTAVTLELDDNGLPLHTDATVRIRPRLFLEGGFYVELTSGSPSAPVLSDGGSIPLPQTSDPVQFHQMLSVFERPLRDRLRDTFGELAIGLTGGGAEGLREATKNLGPALRDVAIDTQAARGTEPHDVSRLVSSASRVTGALADDPRSLADLVTNFRRTADALSADDTALGDGLSELDLLVRSAPSALRALDGTLPVAERVLRGIHPAVRVAPQSLTQSAEFIELLGSLVAPGARERTVAGLRATFVDLPTLLVRMSLLFPVTKDLSDCLHSNIIPILKAKVPDGALSEDRPVWQDFAHSLVGLTSASQDFDGNGYAIRYQFGGGSEGLSTDALPGLGVLRAQAPPNLQTRPLPRADGAPPIHRDVVCSTQPVPSLETPAGSGS